MTAPFVQAGRGNYIVKIDNTAISRSEFQASLGHREVVGAHSDPDFRAALETYTHLLFGPAGLRSRSQVRGSTQNIGQVNTGQVRSQVR